MNKVLIVSLLFAFTFSLTLHQEEEYASKEVQDTWDELSVDVLINNQWKFSNDGGILGKLIFNEDGTISNYNVDNEKLWAFDQNNNLVVKRSDGVPTTVYTHAFRDFFGKWHLEGRFKLLDNGWRHFLVQL